MVIVLKGNDLAGLALALEAVKCRAGEDGIRHGSRQVLVLDPSSEEISRLCRLLRRADRRPLARALANGHRKDGLSRFEEVADAAVPE
jgi:hypothetical protein